MSIFSLIKGGKEHGVFGMRMFFVTHNKTAIYLDKLTLTDESTHLS